MSRISSKVDSVWYRYDDLLNSGDITLVGNRILKALKEEHVYILIYYINC